MGLWTSTTQFPMNHNSPRLYNLGTSLDRCTRSMSGKYPWFVLKKMMKGFWNILSLIHGGNLLCTQRCDQCGILVDDYRALKQASTWEQHFTVLSGHFIPTSDNFALNGGLVLGIHRESSRLGSQGSFFAPGRNTRIACYHASLHLLNMLPLSLLPLVGLMCRHGPPSSCLPHIWGGVAWLHAALGTIRCQVIDAWEILIKSMALKAAAGELGSFAVELSSKVQGRPQYDPIISNISIWYMNAWKSWFHCRSFPKLRAAVVAADLHE